MHSPNLKAEAASLAAPTRAPGVTPAARAAAAPSYGRPVRFSGPAGLYRPDDDTDTPIVNAMLARLPGAQQALAALVVAFSLALVYEAPHVAMIEVATALATTRQALGLLRRFYGVLALAWRVGRRSVFSPLYDALVRGVMNIPPDVAAAARPTLAVFLLWPVPIGWRRLHQGALIRHGHSRAVGAGATVRIVTLVVRLRAAGGVRRRAGRQHHRRAGDAGQRHRRGALYRPGRPPPAARPARRRRRRPGPRPLTLRALWEVFWPLAGTAVLNTLNRPLLSAGIAAAALAAGGTHGRGGPGRLGRGLGLSSWSTGRRVLSQVAIAWDADPRPGMRRRGARGPARRWGWRLPRWWPWSPGPRWPAGCWTDLRRTPALAALALPVLRLLVPVPILAAAGALLRGRLIAGAAPAPCAPPSWSIWLC